MKVLIKQCDWEITTKCNLNCLHCIINKQRKELNTVQCKKIIDILNKLGCKTINFTGGEPLLRKDFFEILTYSNSNKLKNRIFTNGTLINKQNIKSLKNLIEYIGFSLDGLRTSNDKIRGENSFKKTINSIKLAKRNSINFGIYATLNKLNLNKLEEFLVFIKKLKPMNVSLNEVVFRGKAKKNRKDLLCNLDSDIILAKIKKIFPKERFRKEKGCLINPKKIFLISDGRFYLCTEISQLKPSLYIGRFLPPNFRKYSLFLKNYKNLKLPSKCPYVTYASDKISINLLTKNKCWMVR